MLREPLAKSRRRWATALRCGGIVIYSLALWRSERVG
jgi:hypothetical protein